MKADVLQGSLTVAIRYGATRHQFGPPGSPEIAVLDYTSQQLKLMPMLATCYALHFTSRFLVDQYAEMKQTREEDIIADVHALSAGKPALLQHIFPESVLENKETLIYVYQWHCRSEGVHHQFHCDVTLDMP